MERWPTTVRSFGKYEPIDERCDGNNFDGGEMYLKHAAHPGESNLSLQKPRSENRLRFSVRSSRSPNTSETWWIYWTAEMGDETPDEKDDG